MPTVLITGANGNMGRAVNQLLLSRGWNTVGLDVEDGDLTKPANVETIVKKLPNDLYAAALLVGGIRAGKPLEDTSLEDIQFMFNLNVVSAFNVMKAIFSRLKKGGGGSIVTIGAQVVQHPTKNRAAYAVSKSAVVALTRAAAEEGREFGVRANSILPSVLKTPENIEWAGEDEAKNWPTPEDVAETIAVLIDPHCSITGAIIPMFGKIQF